MRIGLTYDLRSDYLAIGYNDEQTAEFDSIDTIDAIDDALQALGFETDRIGHIRSLTARLAAGERWGLVFNICEGMHGVSREAQVPALLDAYAVPFVFSDALTMAMTLDKAIAKRVVRDMGVPTAPFAVVTTPGDVARLKLPWPLFAKPLAEGTGKGISAISKVNDALELAITCRTLLNRHRQPVLVETYLPGREFTVGIVGNGRSARAIGVMEITLGERAEAHGYSFENKEHYEDRVTYKLAYDKEARRAERVALSAWHALRCRDGGRVDLRSDHRGQPHFLEVNPLAGLHPLRSDLVILARLAGMDYQHLISAIVNAALRRHRLSPARSVSRPGLGGMIAHGNAPPAPHGPPPRAVILHSHLAVEPTPDDLDTLVQVEAAHSALQRRGWRCTRMAWTGEAQLAQRLLKRRPALVVNLVEAIDSSAVTIHRAPRLLSTLGLAFTGCNAEAVALTTHKIEAKRAMLRAGITTPPWLADNGRLRGARAWPGGFIVKSTNEDASVGIDSASVVRNAQAARDLVAAKTAQLGGEWFAEGFLEGREFNLALLQRAPWGSPEVLPAAEIEFVDFAPDQPRIVDYASKWDPESVGYRNTRVRHDFASADRLLLRRLERIALRCWKLFGLSGYARVDMRVDVSGRAWVLEVNANPCLSPDAGFAAAAARAGLGLDDVFACISHAAIQRAATSESTAAA